MSDTVHGELLSETQTEEKMSSDTLCQIASRQKLMISAIVFQLIMNTVAKGIPGDRDLVIAALVTIAAMVFVTVSVVRLSMSINPTSSTVWLGFFSLLPILNLVVILILSRQSNAEFRKHGIAVGFLGTNEEEIRQKSLSL